MDKSALQEEGTENLTSNTENMNISGHTSQISSIKSLGKDPEQWFNAYKDLEEIEEGMRKRKILQHFFIQASKNLDSAILKHNKHYALLLAHEALFYGEIDAEDARSTFQMALTLCQRSAILYIMYAQFEVDQGRRNKAMKILGHGEVRIENPTEIIAAKKKLEEGFDTIDGGLTRKKKNKKISLQNITNIAKPFERTATNNRKSSPPEQQVIPKAAMGPTPASESISTPKVPVLSSLQSSCLKTPELGSGPNVTPPQKSSFKALLELDLKSPASPNLVYFSTKKKNPLLPSSNLTLDNLSMKEPSKRSLSVDLSDSSYSRTSAHHGSVGRTSPTSKMLSNCKTTEKKPQRATRGPQAPRRVLVTRANTNNSDDSDGDITPIQKSPEEKEDANQEPKSSRPTNQPRFVFDILNEKENIPDDVKSRLQPAYQNGKNAPSENFTHSNNRSRVPSGSSVSSENVPLKGGSSPPWGPLERVPEIPSVQKNHFVHNPLQIVTPNSNPQHIPISTRPPLGTILQNGPHHAPYPNQYALPPHQFIPPQAPHPNNNDHPGYHLNNPYHQTPMYPPSAPHPVFQSMHQKKVLQINGVSYIVWKALGKGGSSKVYEVLNPVTMETLAVKQVNLSGCEQSVLEGYKNEIDFLNRLQGCKYIIRLKDYEIRENYLFLVMERGSIDLSGFLKKQRADGEALDMIDILGFWKNMLKAVEKIHKLGVIHLDLKPANFLVVDYTLKLIDFGIANSIQVDATSVIKDTQFGTLNYMAPEMINDMSGSVGGSNAPKFKVGPKADVWSLGCILYYIMYGRTPFQHIHNQAMKLFAITNEKHRIEYPEFPRKELIEIVQACLIRDPKKRPSVEILLNHPLLK